jgi:hypothetical protein
MLFAALALFVYINICGAIMTKNDRLKISKWQNASKKANDIKKSIEDLLDGFTQEEKNSIRYAQLIECLTLHFNHAIDINYKKKTSFWTTPLSFAWIKVNKWFIIMLFSSPVIAKVIEWIAQVLTKVNISGGN